MNIKNITVVVEPEPPGTSFSIILEDGQPVPNLKSIHQLANYSQLVDELREQTSAKVTLVEDFLHTTSPNGIVILYPRHWGYAFEEVLNVCEPELGETLPQRLVLLHISRGEVLELVRQYPLAALVDKVYYDDWWEVGQGSPQQQIMYGRTAVAKEIGGYIGFEFGHGQYCYMRGKESERLPAFLMRYLEAYVRMVPGISELDL